MEQQMDEHDDEEVVDWEADEPGADMEMTLDVRKELEGLMQEDPDTQRMRRIETASAWISFVNEGEEAPPFMRLVHGVGMPEHEELQSVREMKGRAVEHVRWRRVEAPRDILAVARVTMMRTVVIKP